MAREYDIPLRHVEVRSRYKTNKIVNGPYDPEQRTMRMAVLERHFIVRGPITEEQVQRLLWGAENCPLSNTVRGSPLRLRDTIEVIRE